MAAAAAAAAWLGLAALLTAWPSAAAAQAQPAAAVPEWSAAARQRLMLGPAEQAGAARAERQRLLDEAEVQLTTGLTEQARDKLERAALMLHAPDTESALVRADLQAGQYRRALAFAAHAAGAHQREWPAGMALYAWLLRIGGQDRVADHLLAQALARHPDAPALQAAQRSLASPWPSTGPSIGPSTGPALEALQLHPYALGDAVPAPARSAGAAVLLPDGVRALTEAALLDGAIAIWLRDGMGRTVAADRDGPADVQGVQRLRLHTALPQPPVVTSAQLPYAGSPGYVLDHAPGSAQPAWPLLRQGFFGRMLARDGQPVADPVLGFDLPDGPRGGPVYDAQGRWAGVAVTGADGRVRLVPAGPAMAGPMVTSTATPAADAPAPRQRPAADEVYERALRQTLQLLVQR